MSRKIGFWTVFSIVTGSQIGSGVFMLPTSLAPFGMLSLLGWLISGAGAIMLALVFAKLCASFPRTGGPHAYVQETFGSTCGFFTGWTYWVISWVSTTAVISASVGYLSPLLGNPSAFSQLLLEIFLLLTITGFNLRGVKTAGTIEFFLTLLKVIPLLVIPFLALFYFSPHNFAPVTSISLSIPQAISHVTLLTLWGFIGLESATTPAGSIKNPGKTIPRAVVFGTLTVALLYLINSIGIMGVLPAQDLAISKTPYADCAQRMLGGNWHLIVSLIAAMVCIGTLNAWMLTSGQIALGIAQDKLFPKFFAKTNRWGAPYNALIVSSFSMIPLLVLTFNENLAHQITNIIDFSVTAFLFVYFMCCLAFFKLLIQQKNTSWKHWAYGIIAFIFCGWIICATPINTLVISSLFVLSGLPFYFMQKKHSA